MKKLIINSLGIASVLSMIIVLAAKVGFNDREDVGRPRHAEVQTDENNVSESELASMCDRIDRLSDEVSDIEPKTGANAAIDENAYSSDSGLERRFDEALTGAPVYDPNDYPNENTPRPVNDRNINIIDDYEQPKAAEVIE
jgi:hypothetical protein